MLTECLFGVVEIDELNEMYTHALTAIIMHNSLYKFSITNYSDNGENGFNTGGHFRMERHPLAFLLMLCDEIQCWDRTSYGKSSRGELHPFDCEPKPEVKTAAEKTVDKTVSAAEVKTPEPAAEKQQPSKTRAASSTGDITYTLYGKQYTDNQANMMLRVFEEVLTRHPEAVDEIFRNPEAPAIRCASRINYKLPENKTDDMPSRYLAGNFFDINGGIFVGTSLNYPEKLRNISQLLSICGEVYSIYGKEYSVDRTKMMTDILKFIIEKHFDKKEELAQLLCVKLAPLSELQNLNYFRAGREFTYQDVTYSIGTSFSRNDKLRQIKKAIKITGENPDNFVVQGREM